MQIVKTYNKFYKYRIIEEKNSLGAFSVEYRFSIISAIAMTFILYLASKFAITFLNMNIPNTVIIGASVFFCFFGSLKWRTASSGENLTKEEALSLIEKLGKGLSTA